MKLEEIIEKYDNLSKEYKKQQQLSVEDFNNLKTYELVEDYYEENRDFSDNSVRYKVLDKGTKLKCIMDYGNCFLWCGEKYGSRHYRIPKDILKQL